MSPAGGTGWAVGGRAHVFVENVDSPEPCPGDLHHLEKVLRLRGDEPVTISDGLGAWRLCRVAAGGLAAGGLEVTGAIVREPRPTPAVTVAFAPTKGERPEWAVQKLTELGVDAIVTFTARRSVVRWSGPRGAVASERLQRVAREAAMQSRRVWMPEVSDAGSLADVVASFGDRVSMACPGGQAPTLARPVVVVGPEGGWDPSELEMGLPHVGLGPQVLRSETAAVTAAALLGALRSGLVLPARP